MEVNIEKLIDQWYEKEEAKAPLRPLEDRILIEKVDAEERTAGGLIIPDTAKEKSLQGTVIAAGPGRTDDLGNRIPMETKIGDKVLVPKYTGSEITVDKINYLVISEKDVLAILE